MTVRSFFPALALAATLTMTCAAQAQDVAAGEKSFNKCRACHQVGETAKNSVGPELNGLFGRKSGAVAGYNYSDANKNSGITWDEAVFADYIKDPKAKIPGTKMAFAGIKKRKRSRISPRSSSSSRRTARKPTELQAVAV